MEKDPIIKPFGLQRTIGLATGVSMIINGIIGSGIYIAPKGVLAATNSVGMCLILWVICGFIPILGAFCFIELCSVVPESGGVFIYINRGFSQINKRLGELISFLYSWSIIAIIRPCSLGTQSLVFATYFLNLFIGKCGPPEILIKLTAICVLCIGAFLNVYSIKLTNKIIVALASTKIISLILIIIGGIVRLGLGYTKHFQNSFAGTSTNAFTIINGFFTGLWAYEGWSGLNNVTEEIKNPKRNLPLSIIISLCMVITFYVMTNVSYFTVMSKDELLASRGVAITWAEAVLGSYFDWVISVVVCLSVFSNITSSFFASSRLSFKAAREGLMVDILAMVNVNRNTPEPSVMILAIMAIIYLNLSNVRDLVNIFSFTTWLFYALSTISLLILRYKKREVERIIKAPLIIPIVFLLISVYLVISPFFQNAKIEYVSVLIVELVGCVLYYVFLYKKFKLPYFNFVTKFIKNLLQVDLPLKQHD